MEHKYSIEGMSCMGCKSHVESTLQKVEGVEKVNVDLDKEEATIQMHSHIPLENLQKALKEGGGNYRIELPGKKKSR